jgi:hypothetical protein
MRGSAVCVSIGLALSACSSFDAADTPIVDGGTHPSTSPDGGAPQPDSGSAPDAGTTVTCPCPAGAFCDVFDRQNPIGNGWAGFGQTSDATRFKIQPNASASCANSLHVDVGNATSGDSARMLFRAVGPPNDTLTIELDLTVDVDLSAFTQGGSSAIIAFAPASTQFASNQPFVELGAHNGSFALRVWNTGSGNKEVPFLLTPGVSHHIRWTVQPVKGALGATTLTLDRGAAPIIDETIGGLDAASQFGLYLGVGSAQGSPQMVATISQFVLTTQ